MKETIGEKIFRLRKKMVLNQADIHHNQSQVALIEKGGDVTKTGGIVNPDENTLRIIAGNMDMTFEELINETTWKKPEIPLKNNEIAFSPVIVDVEIDDTGNISWAHKPYPLYNNKGEKNIYCLDTGQKLIDRCKKCDRQVEDVKQEYCIGCGSRLFAEFTLPMDTYEKKMGGLISGDARFLDRSLRELALDISIHKDIIGYIELLPTINNYPEKKKLIDAIIKESNEKMRLEIQGFENDNYLIPEHILNQFKFWLQVEKAQRRKLILRIANTELLTNEEAVKEDLIVSVFQRLQDEIQFSESIDSNLLMDIIKDLSSSKTSGKLLKNLQKRLSQIASTNDQNDEEKISEDGNSDTAAVNNAEHENNNAN